MDINANGININVSGGKVFVDGKEVPRDKGTGSDRQESEDSKVARLALEARYPNVKFKGDCSKIVIENGVVLEGGVVIQQCDDAVIAVTGRSVLAQGVHVSTPETCTVSFNSFSMSGSTITMSSDISIGGGGVSINSSASSGTTGVRIDNTTIGRFAEISGLSIVLKNSKVSDKRRVVGPGSGTIKINQSEILADVVCAGSGNLTVEDSKIAATINSNGSGNIKVESSSTVNGNISLTGSGNITVSGSVVQPSGSLSVIGSGNIQANGCTVSTSCCVIGSQSIKI